MSSPRLFLRLTAICAMASVITTLLNTQLVHFYPAPVTFQDRVLLSTHSVYLFRQWVLWLHPLVTLLLAVGLYQAVRATERGWAQAGLLFGFLEKGLEFVGQTLHLFTVNLNWRSAYLAASTAAERDNIERKLALFADVWNDCYLVLWVSYALFAIFFAVALREDPSARWLRWSLYLTALLTAVMVVSDYGKQAWMAAVLPVAYPFGMTICRLFTAVFLWKKSNQVTV